MSSPFIPCPLEYTDYPAGGSATPIIIAARDPSDSSDLYPAGYLWLSSLDMYTLDVNGQRVYGSGSIFVQSGNTAGSANWSAMTAGSSSLNTLSDGSTIVSPSGSSNIALEGTANQITSTGDNPSHTITFSIPTTFIAPGSIASTSTLTAGSTLTVTTDATIGNDLTVTNNTSIGGNLTVTGSITFGGISVNGTVAFNTAGAGTTSIGNAAAGAITITTGTGNFSLVGGGNTVGIANDAAANLVTLGSTTAGAALTLQAGTGDMSLTGSTTSKIYIGSSTQTGLITLGRSTDGQDIDIGSADNTFAQVIDIGNGASGANSTVRILSGTGAAGAGTILLGNNPRVTVASLADVAPSASRTVTVGGGTVVVAAVTDTIDIGPDGATTNANSVKTVNVNTGGVTLGQVLTNIASGAVTSGTHTTSIATGNRAAGTMALNIMTGTGTKTANLGNADAGTTFNIDAVTLINDSVNANTSINTGTSTGTVAIGNALATAITADAVAISLDATDASNFTVTGAANLTLASSAGAVIVDSGLNAVEAIYLHANAGASETIRIRSDQGTSATSVDIESDVGGISLVAGLSAANAIVINATGGAGGIDISTGGGSVDISSSGFVTMAPATDTQASPTAASTLNVNVGAATFTGFTTASAASQVFTITNSIITTSSKIFVTVCNEGANDAQMTVMRVKRLAGSMEVTCTNNGAAALNGNVTVNFWVIAA